MVNNEDASFWVVTVNERMSMFIQSIYERKCYIKQYYQYKTVFCCETCIYNQRLLNAIAHKHTAVDDYTASYMITVMFIYIVSIYYNSVTVFAILTIFLLSYMMTIW